jgi:type I restriction enzyme M protein
VASVCDIGEWSGRFFIAMSYDDGEALRPRIERGPLTVVEAARQIPKADFAYNSRSPMLTGEIRGQIDRIWDAFWSGGISNPLEVIEQITYLLCLRRLDDLQTLEENLAARTKKPIRRRIFPEGKDPRKRPYEDLRWSRFKNMSPPEMFKVVGEHVFQFLRTLGGDDSTYAHHMKDARFTIPTPGLLAKVVDLIADVPMQDRDTKGDLYEYMLAKIAQENRCYSLSAGGAAEL